MDTNIILILIILFVLLTKTKCKENYSNVLCIGKHQVFCERSDECIWNGSICIPKPRTRQRLR